MKQNFQLTHTNGSILDDPTAFRRLIGHSLYLSKTRPDIAFLLKTKSIIDSHSPRKPLKSSPWQGLFTLAIHLYFTTKRFY